MINSTQLQVLFSALSVTLLGGVSGNAAVVSGRSIRITVSTEGNGSELVQIRDGGAWVDALKTTGSVLRSAGVAQSSLCIVRTVEAQGSKLIVKGACDNGAFMREIELKPDSDAIAVTVTFTPNVPKSVVSVEDRIVFSPAPHQVDTPTQGPLDFEWSPNIKGLQDEVDPYHSFKSPAVIFQQGRVFAAIVPDLDSLTKSNLQKQPVALDLDVTSGDHAWFSYGVLANKPFGHSYFRRSSDTPLETSDGPIAYRYWILASPQGPSLGYREVSRFLWEKYGSTALKNSLDLQRDLLRPELFLFDDWRQEAWARYAGEKYVEFDCGGARCGAIVSNRNPWGKWNETPPKDDAWFNSWFQTLRTAYGWYLFGKQTNNAEMQAKAERILNLALKSPQHDGVFPSIYLIDTKKWLNDDGWAGYSDDYHTFCMSWTGYWLIRWADLLPARKPEILAYLKPYADFLLRVQAPSGVIASWFDEHLNARPEFKDFNAETAGSALFLAQFSEFAGDPRYLKAAIRAEDFITAAVIPRQRWYDFETFLSCARKPYDFYDRWTAQYPQNNLSTMQAAQALLKIYHLTGEKKYFEQGQQVVDYLLLTQQVWNNPLMSPKMVGGTTTQNTDAEWSDARQCYLAALLLDYYQDNGGLDYLERSVGAARSGFGAAPWENWAHRGYADVHGAMSGFHWGTGSEMASVEMMSPILGDAFVNVRRGHGVGFNACNVTNVDVSGTTVKFNIDAMPGGRRLLVRFGGLEHKATYKPVLNGGTPILAAGAELAAHGHSFQL